ncbi:CTP synthase, partial [Eubacterium sp.]
ILYAVPMMLKEQKMDEVVMKKLGIDAPNQDLSDWEEMLYALRNPKQTVKIALVGKYVELHDSYISVNEALKHGGISTMSAVDIHWIDSESLEADNANLDEILGDMDGILVPGGFGSRGIEGKILAANYARTHGIPYLGICLGMQIAIIEFARNVLNMQGANSAEINPETPFPLIDILPEKKNISDLGGTLRLGQYPCILNEKSKSYQLYGEKEIFERHRHRYEVNNDYRDSLLQGGMIFAGTSPDNHIVEMIELPDHPWFVACQFHPEFKSRPNKPHPLFRGFVTAAAERMKNKK